MRQSAFLRWVICVFVVTSLGIGGISLAQDATPPPTVEQPTAAPAPFEYIVRYGDSLSGIARRFATTTSEIAKLNGIVNPNTIFQGQTLLIPPPGFDVDSAVQQPTTYTVRAGDTLYQIAVRFNTTVDELRRLNGLSYSSVIYRGQVLNLPALDLVVPSIAEVTPETTVEAVAPTTEVTPETTVEAVPPTAEVTPETTVEAVAPTTEVTPETTVEAVPPTAEVTPETTVEAVTPTTEVTPLPTEAPLPLEPIAPAVGFGYGVITFLPNSNVEGYVEKVTGLGVDWVRLNVDWREVEAVQGEPNFAQLDATIDVLNSRGINILLTVSSSPTWARTETVEDGPPDDFGQFASFTGQLAARYAGRAQAYQIWNEPNLRREWASTVHPIGAQAYVGLLSAAYSAIKAADPQAIVITAGLAPTGFNDGVNAIDDRVFLRALYAQNVISVSDGIAANPGGWANPPESTCCTAAEGVESHYDSRTFFFKDTLEDYHAIMIENGDSRLMWVTEFGWGTVEGADLPAPGESYKFVLYNDPGKQASYAARAFELGKSLNYVGPMFLNNLNGCISDARRVENCYYSLIGPDGLDRPAYRAISLLPK